MPNPSIIADLILRDLTAPEVAKIAANIQQTLSGISIQLPVAAPQTQQAIKTIQGVTAAADKEAAKMSALHARALAENIAIDEKRAAQAAKAATKIVTIEAEAATKLDKIRRQEQVNRLLYSQLTPKERDALGKRLGRSTVTMEDPFGSLISKEGITARAKSLFAGQVGSLIVYGTALRATTALVQNYVTANTELEDSLARVSTVLEGSAEEQGKQYAQLRDQAIEWGRTHAQSAKDAADAMYYLLSAGESVQEAQANLPAVLNLSYGGFLDAAFAAETAATAYELFSKEGLSMLDIVNKIQKSANISQVTVEQYASAFNYVASTADQAKISFDQISAAIATLGTLGLRGSKGGRNLDEAIGQLLRKKEDLKAMGIEIEDTGGNLKNLGDIVQEFRAKLGSKIDVSELKLLREIFGQQGGRAFGLLIENADLYREMLERIKKTEGETFDAAFKRGDTLSQIWERWKNQLEAVAQRLSEINEIVKVILAGGQGSRERDFISQLIGGEQGSEGIRAAIRKIGDQTGVELARTLDELRSKYADKKIFQDDDIASLFSPGIAGKGIFTADEEELATAKKQMIAFFEKLAAELSRDESIKNTRLVLADVLHMRAEDLQLFSFGPGDVDAIKRDAKGFFTQLQSEVAGDIGTGFIGREGGEKLLAAIKVILGSLTDDKEWRKPVDEINRALARLQVNVSKAQLDALRSIKTEDFGKRADIIDLELIVNLKKNQEEYLRAVESLPVKLKDDAKAYRQAMGLLREELNFKNLADRNRSEADTIRLNLDIQFGDTAIARLRQDLAQAVIGVAKSIPDSVLTLNEKLALVDATTQAETERNFQEYLRKLKALPDEILLNEGRFSEAKTALLDALSMENLATRNKGFYEKDKQVRQEFIRSFEADIARQQRLQELFLDQADAGDEQRRTKRNDLLKQELSGLSKELVPSLQLQFGPQGLGTDVDAWFKKLDAIAKIRESLAGIDTTNATPEVLAKVSEQIRTIGTDAGINAEQLDKFVEKLLGIDPKIESTTDVLHAFTGAFGDLAGAMQIVGNDKTWSGIAKGINLVDDSYTRIQKSLDLISGGKGLQGFLGIGGAVFNIIGVLGSILSREDDKPNKIGIEEYKYESGRNVSANYGRAQTINVQVDLNPNFNFLDASQLTQQRQREIAYELGPEIDGYFEDTGRFKRN